MLAKEKQNLDLRLLPLITEMTWNKYDKDYIEETFDLVKEYYDRVMKAQANVQKILSSINAWGDVPLFVRKDNHNDALLDIVNRDITVSNRFRRALVSNRLAEKVVLDENYRLYFNIPPSCPCSSGSEYSEDEEDDENDARRKSGTASQRQQTLTAESLGDLNRLREPFSTTVIISDENAILYTPYQEYVDGLVGMAIMSAVHTRYNY